ncbi:helix-turn-helix domain-containing protein [Cytobacillus horneckiae]|uniref:XRE family transcriptional regulator n=1 Tax=Cytobacillus horneckiae TaxID=549687 RepID=A0A2N0ZGY9_9BACI|nr:helix-turn-helix transcriptional regulator [Cytobacillus horneckiae]MED2940689.1 helix-turn-helix transcriptional regulator [Cytobacillus horneckiae]PKG28780.1 XRE family transcriptional regulator [Cytobacillus horneckiae]
MQYGTFLKKLRLIRGYSQEEMAEQMLMPRTTISKVENNKMELKLSDAIRWGQITNAPEALAAMLCGVDIASLTKLLTMLVGGMIRWI